MTTAAFLAIAVVTGVAVLVIAASVALAGPTNPPAESRPAAGTTATESLATPKAATCAHCDADGTPCRFHRGFAAGWTAARHHELAGVDVTHADRMPEART